VTDRRRQAKKNRRVFSPEKFCAGSSAPGVSRENLAAHLPLAGRLKLYKYWRPDHEIAVRGCLLKVPCTGLIYNQKRRADDYQ
jgi:hypothetical protein